VRRALSLLLLAATALAGCGSGGTDPILGAALDEASGILPIPGREEPAPSAPARPVTRADIERSDTAAIWARLEGDDTPTLLYAVAANGGTVTFMSGLRQSVILRGSLVYGTRGLGTNLMSAWSDGYDPLVRPTPPASWPARVVRHYEFPADRPEGVVMTFDCRFERGAASEMTILQVRHTGVEISETCAGPAGTFENLHFADPGSGFVWRTLQWTGPTMPLIDVQVIEPYTGG
jgi:Group 4 capsule polysaccharide lipoprotein gfcB, YjbF